MACKFCDWKKNYTPIFENDRAIACWGSPYVKGHVKVILKRHADNLTELSGDELSSLMDAWTVVGRAIEKVLKPDIINWQINCNWTRHVHGHIYPRWRSDPDWGEPIQLPTHKEEKEKSYLAKPLTDSQKKRIEKLLLP